MPRDQHKDLERFARRVLNILEEQENWGADTIAAIAESAELHDLGTVSDDGLFKATVPVCHEGEPL